MPDPRRTLADLDGCVIDRRRFLAFTGALAGTAAYAQLRGDLAVARAAASGLPVPARASPPVIPLPSGVSLWTRLAPEPLNAGGGMPPKDIAVQWQVASDSRFRRVVKTGTAAAIPELAHSVHVDVRGLRPGREYFYRFLTSSDTSPVGRTRTAPAAGAQVSGLTFAFASCQKWDDGFYSPYHRMAEEDIELVIHLGRLHLRVRSRFRWRSRNAKLPGTFGKECVTLDRYRLQHSLYKTDPDLQECHRLFPWAVTWDDHEVANDYSGIYPEFAEHEPGVPAAPRGRLPGLLRAHAGAAERASPGPNETRLYRRLGYGDIADFNLLDTRQYRTDNPCGDGEQPPCDAGLDPNATMTGAAQERWLLGRPGALVGALERDRTGRDDGPAEARCRRRPLLERRVGRLAGPARPHPPAHRRRGGARTRS